MDEQQHTIALLAQTVQEIFPVSLLLFSSFTGRQSIPVKSRIFRQKELAWKLLFVSSCRTRYQHACVMKIKIFSENHFFFRYPDEGGVSELLPYEVHSKFYTTGDEDGLRTYVSWILARIRTSFIITAI
jgi:hypothetical protein